MPSTNRILEFELRNNRDAQVFLTRWLKGDELNFLGPGVTPLPPAAASDFIPMTGVTDTVFPVYGDMTILDADETGDYSTILAICNQHVWLNVASIDVATVATLTGISVSETTGAGVVDDTELITIDEAANYQSYKKWLQLAYDIGVIGYIDFKNTLRRIVGYRMDVRTSSGLGDLAIEITSVVNLGNNKFNLITLEKYGFDSRANDGDYVDEARAGVRDVLMEVQLAPNNRELGLKALDFLEYWGDDSLIHGNDNGGLIVYFKGVDGDTITGGITAIDHVTLTMYLH